VGCSLYIGTENCCSIERYQEPLRCAVALREKSETAQLLVMTRR